MEMIPPKKLHSKRKVASSNCIYVPSKHPRLPSLKQLTPQPWRGHMIQAGPVRSPHSLGHRDWPRGGGGTQAEPITCLPQDFSVRNPGRSYLLWEVTVPQGVERLLATRALGEKEDRNKRRGSQTWWPSLAGKVCLQFWVASAYVILSCIRKFQFLL